MSHQRKTYDKSKNKQLAKKTPKVNGFKGGCYFDGLKQRDIRVFRAWDRNQLSKRTNKKIHQSKETMQNGDYKLVDDGARYW